MAGINNEAPKEILENVSNLVFRLRKSAVLTDASDKNDANV